jgi:hypothetical protein
MSITEELDKLSLELRSIAEEIGLMKNKECNMEPGPAREKLKRLIRQKQYQALFYIEKIENLSNEKRQKSDYQPLTT